MLCHWLRMMCVKTISSMQATSPHICVSVCHCPIFQCQHSSVLQKSSSAIRFAFRIDTSQLPYLETSVNRHNSLCLLLKHYTTAFVALKRKILLQCGVYFVVRFSYIFYVNIVPTKLNAEFLGHSSIAKTC